MNKFVSSLLGSFAGTWIAFFVFGVFIFFFGIAAISSMSFSSAIPKVESNSILCINLTGTIKDKPDNKTLSELVNENWQVSENLHDILIAINHAETNDNIEGIYLNCGFQSTLASPQLPLSATPSPTLKRNQANGSMHTDLDFLKKTIISHPLPTAYL